MSEKTPRSAANEAAPADNAPLSDAAAIHAGGSAATASAEHKEPFDTHRERPARPRRDGRGSRQGGLSPMNQIMALDRDILQLVARRARLLKAAYSPRPMVPNDAETPEGEAPKPQPARRAPGSRISAHTRVEKNLREAWQAEAAKISPDSRLNRDLFALLQDISVPDRADSRPKTEGFNLAPPRMPVKVDLPAFVSRRAVLLHCALATGCDADIRLEHVPLGDQLLDGIKALNQAGGRLSWEGGDTVIARGAAFNTQDAVVFVGNEATALYLISFMAAPEMSKIKFMGGPDLKHLDVTDLRRFLPELGVRLAPVVPGGKGLPVRLECSGLLPDKIQVPAFLPRDAVYCLLVAAAIWNRHTTIDCSAHPDGAACCAAVLPIVSAWGAKFSENGNSVRFSPAALRAPNPASLHMDPLLSGFFLALPAFANGVTKLSGNWAAALHESHSWTDLLRAAGLAVSRTDEGIASQRSGTKPTQPLQADGETLPFALALAALRAGDGGACPVLLPPSCESLLPLMEEFLEQLGCVYSLPENMEQADAILVSRAENAVAPRSWTAPSAAWAFALALGAYIRPGLLLSNPGCVADVLPVFWNIFNTLPEPRLPRPQAPAQQDAPEPQRRRRVIAGKAQRIEE